RRYRARPRGSAPAWARAGYDGRGAAQAAHCRRCDRGVTRPAGSEARAPRTTTVPRCGTPTGEPHRGTVPARREAATRSVPVVLRLVRPLDVDADVGGLLLVHLRQVHPERVEVQARHLFVELLREHVDLVLILAVLG